MSMHTSIPLWYVSDPPLEVFKTSPKQDFHSPGKALPKQEFCSIFAPNFTSKQAFCKDMFGGIEDFEKMTPKFPLIESRKTLFLK